MSSLLVEYAFYTFDHSTPSLGINIYTMKKYAELHHSHITYAKGNSNYGNLNTVCWVNWDQSCLPKTLDGLGVKNLSSCLMHLFS